MANPMEIKDTDLLQYDVVERDLNLSLFQAGYEAGMRDAFGKRQVAPHLPNEPSWQAGFQVGLECALTAMNTYREVLDPRGYDAARDCAADVMYGDKK